MPKPERGLTELYSDDPERADAVIWDRDAPAVGRRGFLGGAGLAAMSAAVGGTIAFADRFPAGLVPAALAQQAAPPPAPAAAAAAAAAPKTLQMEGKAALVMLGDKPLVAETPEHMLDDAVTPLDRFFIRNNGNLPTVPLDAKAWKITVDGEVNAPLSLTAAELESRFKTVTYRMMLECGGNGRSGFSPQARGNQWTNGGAGCADWTGVPLMEVLKAAGLKPSAKYTAHYGADVHLSGDARPTLSRGVRIEKAMDPHTLIATRMNGKPLTPIHGGPVRLIVPGWAGSASHKWLTRLWIRDKEHDGPGMTGWSYRTARTPIVPGNEKADPKNSAIMEAMPVRSLITNVAHGTTLAPGTRKLPLRGHAWAGERSIKAVHVSIDYGATWRPAKVNAPKNKYAWQRWNAEVTLPSVGYYELWVRATDSAGTMQPHVVGNWNPQGYGGNALHRVAVLVES